MLHSTSNRLFSQKSELGRTTGGAFRPESRKNSSPQAAVGSSNLMFLYKNQHTGPTTDDGFHPASVEPYIMQEEKDA